METKSLRNYKKKDFSWKEDFKMTCFLFWAERTKTFLIGLLNYKGYHALSQQDSPYNRSLVN